VCGKPQLLDKEHQDTLFNPVVIIEVLSPTTEAFDRGKKFMHYQSITSLQDYILIAQEQSLIERFARQPDGKWLLEFAIALEDTLTLASIGCALPLAEVYEQVEFEGGQES
jgi:Uma2 family endonuclease